MGVHYSHGLLDHFSPRPIYAKSISKMGEGYQAVGAHGGLWPTIKASTWRFVERSASGVTSISSHTVLLSHFSDETASVNMCISATLST